jgi:hypothetical protein
MLSLMIECLPYQADVWNSRLRIAITREDVLLEVWRDSDVAG